MNDNRLRAAVLRYTTPHSFDRSADMAVPVLRTSAFVGLSFPTQLSVSRGSIRSSEPESWAVLLVGTFLVSISPVSSRALTMENI